MKLLFRQRLFSWFDSYDIYHEGGEPAYTVKGKLAWGHLLEIYDPEGSHLGTVKQEVLSFLPRFCVYEQDRLIGKISKKLTFLRPSFLMDINGWHIDGDILEWDYTIGDSMGRRVAQITKEVLHITDTYVLDIQDPKDALYVLMAVLAIDAAKCSSSQ